MRSVLLEKHLSLNSCVLQDIQILILKPQSDPGSGPHPYARLSILILILVLVFVPVRVPIRIFVCVFVLLSSLKTANDIHENKIKLFLASCLGEFET